MPNQTTRGLLRRRFMQGLLRQYRDLSGLELFFCDTDNKIVAETTGFSRACKALHKTPAANKTCLRLLMGELNGRSERSSVTRCGALLTVFRRRLRVAGNDMGYLVGGGYRRRQESRSHGRLEKAARETADRAGLTTDKWINDRRRASALSDTELDDHRQRFDNVCDLLRRDLRDAAFERSVSIVKAVKPKKVSWRKQLQEFWTKVRESVALLVPEKHVEIVAFATTANPQAGVRKWPETGTLKAAEVKQWLSAEDQGWATDTKGRLTVLCRCTEVTLAGIRIGAAAAHELDERDVSLLCKLAHAIAEQLTILRQSSARKCCDRLEARLDGVELPEKRLEIVLREVARLLHCDSGHLSLIDREHEWLKVTRRYGSSAQVGLLSTLPLRFGIAGRVAHTGMPAIVPNVSMDPDHKWLADGVAQDESHKYKQEPWERLRRHYKPKHSDGFRKYIEDVRASVHFPLRSGDDTLGVLALHRKGAGPFDLDAVAIALVLVGRAVAETARLDAVESLRRTGRPRTSETQDVERLVGQVKNLPPMVARKELSLALAKAALRVSGAYRTAVRLVGPERHTLSVFAIAPEGSYPEEFLQTPTDLGENRAATWAYKIGTTYTVEDTEKNIDRNGEEIHHYPIEPDAKSHAAIVLIHGTERLGILSVDWDENNAFDDMLIEDLEILATRYASAIKAFDVDEFFKWLDAQLKSLEGAPSPEKAFVAFLPEFLRHAAEAAGCLRGAIFLRDQKSGHLHLTAHLAHPEWAGQADKYYKLDEGVTGWLARQKQPVRIHDIRNNRELEMQDPTLRHVHKITDGVDESEEIVTFLGVPIRAGDEVLGVLRLANHKYDYFTAVDQQNATVAASRLAAWLYEHRDRQRTKAILRLSSRVARASSQRQVAKHVFAALRYVFRECACHIRVRDLADLNEADDTAVLRRLAASHADWKSARLTQRRDEGISGHVWQRRETFHYEDVGASPWIQLAVQEDLRDLDWRGRVGSGVCAPLFAPSARPDHAARRFLGTLHVHKRNEKALLPSDIAFVEEVARIAESGLAAAAGKEVATMNVAIEQAIDDFMVDLLRGRSVRACQPRLLIDVLRGLVQGLGAESGCVFSHGKGRDNVYVLPHAGDAERGTPEPGYSAAVSLLNGATARTFVDIDSDAVCRELLAPHLGTQRDDTQVCLMAMPGETNAVAVFCVAMQHPDAINHSRVLDASKILERVGDLVAIGRQFEEGKRETEISRPLALLGSMFSGLEHETRSPLGILKRAVDFLSSQPRSREDADEMLQVMRAESERLEACLGNMISLVGVAREAFKPVEVLATLDKAIDNATGGADSCAISREYPRQPIWIDGVEDYLQRAFQLIIKNALESTERRVTDARISVRVSAGEWRCEVLVEDNGCGMDAGQKANALIPFQTTKTTGTGLGLPAAYSIVKSHGGDLELESQPGRGTSVYVRLPLRKAGDE